MKISRKKIYLDYAATTPVDKEVLKAMTPYFSEKFGNPGSLHSFGQEALKTIDESREKIAKTIGAGFREIIFTGSATEANNLALRGAVKELRIKNLEFRSSLYSQSSILNPRIIVSAIEHESILETCRDLEREGVEIIYLPVNKQGIVDLEKLKKSLNEQTILVSIMYANNEIGTIQPITEISKLISEFRIQNAELRKESNFKFLIHNSELAMALPLLHTDAVQAFQFLDCDVNPPAGGLGVDLMTLSAHKIYGPKGMGALFIKQIQNSKFKILNSIITGGGQEFGLRSGTENVPAIVGFAKAAELAVKNREKETKRLTAIKDYFIKNIRKIHPRIEINSPEGNLCSPHIANIYFPGHSSQDLLIKLDLAGVAVSSGAACSARAMKPSYVLKAIGLGEQKIKSSLRFSFGKFTTKKEIDETMKIIIKLLIKFKDDL